MPASVRLLLKAVEQAGFVEACPDYTVVEHTYHKGIDKRAIEIYKRNLKSIVALCESQGLKVIFVPQILLEDVLNEWGYAWWIPFIPTNQIDDVMMSYNQILKEVADSSNAIFTPQILEHPWAKQDFVDASHLNGAANKQLAELLTPTVLECLEKGSIE